MRCFDGNSLLTQQKEFTVRESEHNLALNERNAEIKSLTARVINLEAKVKISEKENEILRSKARELEETLNDRENAVQSLQAEAPRLSTSGKAGLNNN